MKTIATYCQLYKEVTLLTKLEDKRHPMLYKKMAMKVFMIFMTLFIIGYLFFIGVTLKDVLRVARPGMEPYNLFNEGMCFLLIFDLFFRFIGQETPAVKVRPFLLLPVPQRVIIEFYLIRIAIQPANLLWMALLIPFALQAVFPFYGVAGCIGYLFGWWMLIVLNSYLYLLTRTLLMKHILWLLLPVVVYGIPLLFVFLPGIDGIRYFFMYLGEGWMKGYLWTYLFVIAGIAVLFSLNSKIQSEAVYSETAGKETTVAVTPGFRTDFTLFDRFGIAGEFIKMEIKSMLRNKSVRSQIIMMLGVTILFSLILSLSPDIYGNAGNAFFCYYCFYMITTPLLHTLSLEGNYMDGLMVHRQLLFDLLKGKYFFYCLLEIIPMLLLLPAVVTETITIGQWLSYYLVVAGFCLPVTMQTAVFTNACTPMNKKLTAGNSENNLGMTLLWMGVIFIIPIGVQYLIAFLISNVAACILLSMAGLAGFLTNSFWLKSLYRRIYLRRYHNMEGFRSSRQL